MPQTLLSTDKAVRRRRASCPSYLACLEVKGVCVHANSIATCVDLFAITSVVQSRFPFTFHFSFRFFVFSCCCCASPSCEGADHFNENPARIAPHGALGSSLPSKALVVGVTLAAGGLFGLFQLQLLPKSWGPWVSKIYFWPTLPFTMIRAFDNYWTKMDGEFAYRLVDSSSSSRRAGNKNFRPCDARVVNLVPEAQ